MVEDGPCIDGGYVIRNHGKKEDIAGYREPKSTGRLWREILRLTEDGGFHIATCNVQISEFCVLPSILGKKSRRVEARHTRGRVGVYRIQKAPGITTGEKENFCILLWREILREADRWGVADGIEKSNLGPKNRMGHFWSSTSEDGGTVDRWPR
jgi:hypothetical protein